jgi:hypothetical protein
VSLLSYAVIVPEKSEPKLSVSHFDNVKIYFGNNELRHLPTPKWETLNLGRTQTKAFE